MRIGTILSVAILGMSTAALAEVASNPAGAPQAMNNMAMNGTMPSADPTPTMPDNGTMSNSTMGNGTSPM